MKRFPYLPAILFAALTFAPFVSEQCPGAPFLNLDFEQGFSGQDSPNAIPGWRSTLPSANSICFDPGCGILTGPHWPSIPDNLVLSGDYSVSLNASSFGIVGGAGYVLQNGTIPLDAKSLRILVGDWSSRETVGMQSETKIISAVQALRITINEQRILMTQIEDLDNGIGIIAGNIAQFAGQDVELRIRATTQNILGPSQFLFDNSIPSIISVAGTATVGGYLDDIVFSPIAVPEPHTLVLLGLFTAMLSQRRCIL